MNLASMSVAQLRKGLDAREFSALDIMTAIEKEITHDAAHAVPINAFIELWLDEAREQARAADTRLAAGERAPLLGIPLAIKDNLNYRGHAASCASRILAGYRATYTAHALENLAHAGAIFVGRTNMDEFAMGSSNETSASGLVRNPHDRTRIPGGSSGGSAAAVAAGFVPVALGSDTGGSIRQPAALCGVVGLKPTYGRVSRRGLIAFASSLDQIGPFTRTVEDSAIVLNHLSGYDPLDSTSLKRDVPDYAAQLDGDLKGIRVGVPKEYFVSGMEPEVEASVRAAIERMREMGAEIREISLPHTEYAVAVYYILATAEASSNLARFDGVRYGRRAEDPSDLYELYARSRGEGFGAEVKRRIMLGTYVLSSGYYDAYYLKALRVRQLVRRDFETAFADVDVIATPTSPQVAFAIGEKAADPVAMYLSDIFTISTNLAGIPGISLPCGKGKGGLPVGLQLMATHFDEARLLRVAHRVEQALQYCT